MLENAEISWKKINSPPLSHTDAGFPHPSCLLLAVITHGDAEGVYSARNTSGIMNQALVAYT